MSLGASSRVASHHCNSGAEPFLLSPNFHEAQNRIYIRVEPETSLGSTESSPRLLSKQTQNPVGTELSAQSETSPPSNRKSRNMQNQTESETVLGRTQKQNTIEPPLSSLLSQKFTESTNSTQHRKQGRSP